MTVIQKSVNTLLKVTGWQNVSYSETHDKSLVLQHPEKGTLKVDQLSDGIKNMLAMVADIAYRCALLNAHLGANAALETEGVILIDEVDMHLHPEWQQTVISSLTEAFPKLQFIVTTHSPQVLSTVAAESIRLIHHEMNDETGAMQSIIERPDTQSRGVASADVLAGLMGLMGVDPIPAVEEASWLSEYKTMIQTGAHESEAGESLKQKLMTHFGADHQVMLECERLIRLQAMKAKLSARKPAEKDEIWQQLNQMQQQRCAYCECSIAGEKKAHIEHLRQRARYPQGTFEWGNLFGSCNHVDSCGTHKDACGAYKHQDLIKMDEEDPERFFMFVVDGTIAVRSGLSEDEVHRANETLRIFNLDAKYGRLRQMRQSAVQGYVQTAEELMAMAEVFDESEWMPLLEQELETIQDQPFSTAIKHALEL